MEKIKRERHCSPYLQRPLRSLDQALKDQADVMRRDNERMLTELRIRSLLSQPQAKKAS